MPVSDPLKIKQIDIVKNDIELLKKEIEMLKSQIKKINIPNDKVYKGGWWWGY